MRRSRSAEHYLAGALFAVCAAIELVHLLSRARWPEFTPAANIVDAMLLVLWTGCAIGLVLHKSWGWSLAVLGSIAALGHGGVLRFAAIPVGVVFLVIGFVSLALLIRIHREFGFMAAGTERVSIA